VGLCKGGGSGKQQNLAELPGMSLPYAGANGFDSGRERGVTAPGVCPDLAAPPLAKLSLPKPLTLPHQLDWRVPKLLHACTLQSIA
jgi:hypothetical protein